MRDKDAIRYQNCYQERKVMIRSMSIKVYLVVIFICMIMPQANFGISMLTKNDPYPMYSTVYDPYLTTWTKQWLKGFNDECYNYESCAFSITPFTQKASTGRNFEHQRRFLGDLQGYWNMLALIYGPDNVGAVSSVPPTATNIQTLSNTQLGFAKQAIFADFFDDNGITVRDNVVISDANPLSAPYILIDGTDHIGNFSVPIKYRKVGVRAEFEAQLFCDFGLTVQIGVSEIRQTFTGLVNRAAELGISNNYAASGGSCPTVGCCPPIGDMTIQPFPNNFCRNIPILQSDGSYTTCDASSPSPTMCTTPFAQIQAELMQPEQANLIFRQLGLTTCNFEETSFEDVRVIAWWRHIYDINKDRYCWPEFLLIPSISLNGIFPSAKKQHRNIIQSLPFGNDGHFSVGFDAGLAIDFVETVEIAFNGGLNWFSTKNKKNYRIPTDTDQSGIFPYATNVKVKPGLNFNFNAIMSAYHFYDRFSAYAEWVYVKHEHDTITLKVADPTFLPHIAECLTKFMSQFVNAAINYDISPNITIGFMGQYPVAQRNAYRSTTYLGTFRAVF